MKICDQPAFSNPNRLLKSLNIGTWPFNLQNLDYDILDLRVVSSRTSKAHEDEMFIIKILIYFKYFPIFLI